MTSLDPGVDDLAVASALGYVHGAVTQLWTSVAPQSGAAVETRFRYAEGDAAVRATAQLVECRADGFSLLLRLRQELQRSGWTVGRPASDPRQLVAGSAHGQLLASFSETTSSVLLDLASHPLHVGADRARGLVRMAVSGAGARLTSR